MTSNSDAHLCKKIECLKHDLAKDRTRIVSLERRLIVLEESISPRAGNTREEPVSTPDLALADAPPPEYPPDSCATPQKVSPSIVTKASPDTESEVASEHCPPPYSSRSSDSDHVITTSQPSIRYGLALAPPSLRAQAAHVKKYTIALRKRFAHCVVGGRLVSELYGGGFKKERTRISEERARESGYADFLFLKGFHQPFLPRVPGRVGLFLSASPRQDDWPDFEKVFVNAVPGQREPDDYLYVGEYELLPAGRLTKEEFAALPPDVSCSYRGCRPSPS
ncbi:hypothetical protein BV25DRAFT_1832477 [Artomyces pyxidatus]|uniref:Uncharacterized protein n=1 Tax=Artomyces pyxidatus TaxID=48021 RepID=A0ACB8SIN6_9AGAM|nr:hypothetical protein BV25DRAFT_1832477 [Artomyces pyxidatus]